MALMKENEKTRKSSVVSMLIGLTLAVGSMLFMLFFSSAGKWPVILYCFLDFPTLFFIVLFSVAEVFISGKRTAPEVLRILQKTAIPNGVVGALMSVVIVLAYLEDKDALGPNLAVCSLFIIYAAIEYVVVFLMRERKTGATP